VIFNFLRTLQKLELPGVPKGKCISDPGFKNVKPEIMICAGAEEGIDPKFYKCRNPE
jgi:hypothetical protein